mmetsp:Transcript_1262/g.3629  ORF Transcript_1262/g.3629 Transcript_1262/m.3629 type:complete len:1021 (-) Transcript_1262:324-3386(-)|eukprot:CAMPEP_0117652480 /NCGR_PEP_ID=MMETSP0804-20121206/2652_1 /TAXON_ID=1074897 /ORGANISM="Tetraselmis astigmatica, Strain CCMP880" /LENGTH=1020 /DNA_ID=CAMNT_0005458535 /DNA_START=900 /DNA_END=3962 /DNA_ORIENTATION=-
MPDTVVASKPRLQLKLEVPVAEVGPVSPLPSDVRQRWQDWSTGECDSPVRARKVKLADVQEKLRLASERRKARQARVVQRAGRTRKIAKKESEPSTANAQAIQAKLDTAEQRRQSTLEHKRQLLSAQHNSVEARCRAMTWRRNRAAKLLQQKWFSFAQSGGTTALLAKQFYDTGALRFNHDSSSSEGDMSGPEDLPLASPSPFRRRISTFEAVAMCIQSPKTLKSLQVLLERLNNWRKVHGNSKSDHLVEPLLRRLFPKIPKDKPLPYYHPRILLSAVMICHHPDVVFNSEGPNEDALSEAARAMLDAFRTLVRHVMESGQQDSSASGATSFVELVRAWDNAWLNYLSAFVLWKKQDAAALEAELIDIAVKMEASMLLKCGNDPDSPRIRGSTDLQGILEQVAEDHKLLRARILKLTGSAGVLRMDGALERVRAEYEAMKQQEAMEAAGDVDLEGHMYGGTTEGTRSPTWAVARDSVGGMSNEAMVHEMLYNPGWQLPGDDLEAAWEEALAAAQTDKPLDALPELNLQEVQGPEALATTMRKHVSRIAEQAFWDSVEQGLQGQPPGAEEAEEVNAAERIAALLVELGEEVIKVLPEQGEGAALAAEIRNTFSRDSLLQALSAPGGNGAASLGQLLGQTANMMERLGSPARSQGNLSGQQLLQAQLADSATGCEGAPSTTRVTVRALRLLFAQLKLLKLDAANARLRMLSAAIAGTEAVRYCSSRFAQKFGLPEGSADPLHLAEKLPNTSSWIAAGGRAAADVSRGISAAGLDPAALAADQQAAPAEMQSGRFPSSGSQRGAAPLRSVPPLTAAEAAVSWRWAVRVGLVGLMTSGAPAVGPNLAETLQLDAKRLHEYQNEVQRILVLSVCMLLYSQSRGIAGQPAASAAELDSVKARLSSVLMDPSLSLRDVAAEMAQALGSDGEEALFGSLQRLLSPSGGAFQSMSAGLGSALCLHLLFPNHSRSGPVKAEITKALARCGGTPLQEEVKTLGANLAAVAAVTEAVHGATVYSHIFSSAQQ